jgi:hypothetical protein
MSSLLRRQLTVQYWSCSSPTSAMTAQEGEVRNRHIMTLAVRHDPQTRSRLAKTQSRNFTGLINRIVRSVFVDVRYSVYIWRRVSTNFGQPMPGAGCLQSINTWYLTPRSLDAEYLVSAQAWGGDLRSIWFHCWSVSNHFLGVGHGEHIRST